MAKWTEGLQKYGNYHEGIVDEEKIDEVLETNKRSTNTGYYVLLQRWAQTYRDNNYHASVETNNGAEALNRLLKYQYLQRQKSMN